MKAIVMERTGPAEVLECRLWPEPPLDRGQARVQMAFAGVNFLDVYRRRGEMKIPLPSIPGMEGAGTVIEVASGVTDVAPGDRVAFTNQPSAYAEQVCVSASTLIPVPDSLSLEQAAALPMQGMTAHYLLHDFRRARAGESILIHAAAGGTGLLLVQWARHLGLRVFATVSSAAKMEAVREAGADEVILYTEKDFAAEVIRLTKGKGVDYILDGVGKSTFLKNLSAAANRGNIVFFGFSSGLPDPIAPGVLTVKSLTLSSARLRNHIIDRNSLLERANAVFAGVEAGWLKIHSHTLPMEHAADAHRLLEQRQTIGKLLLSV